MPKRRIRKLIDRVQEAYWQVWPYDWRPGQVWYRTKCFCWKRYTTIKPRYLPHTWTDRCEVLPHAMFEILSQFIEKECSPGIVDWHHEHAHKITVNGVEKFVRDEMQEIYDWWHKEYNGNDLIREGAMLDGIDVFTPEVNHVPIDMSGNEIAEDDAEMFRMDMIYESAEQEAAHEQSHQAYHDFKQAREDKLTEMMIRLVNVRDYMWT